MTRPVQEKDVQALRTAIVCVGVSGVFLGLFVMLARSQVSIMAVTCTGVGVLVALLGVMRWPSAGISRPRRIFVFWALSALLILELIVPLNYATSRRRVTFDWTEGELRSLSDRTIKVLTRVEAPLHVTTFFLQTEPRQGFIFNVVKDLLDEYRKTNPNILVEHIDPSRETDRMLALQKQLNLKDLSGLASVVFQYGDARKDIPSSRLEPRVPPGMPPGQVRFEELAFHGEEEFTSAILEVTEKEKKGLYFTTNHGELSIDRELTEIASELRRNNYNVVKFAGLASGVPDNCTVLLVIGPDPQAKFTEEEIVSVAQFLGRGGKLLFAASGGEATGLEPLIGDFGIHVGRNYVIDTSSGRAVLTDVVLRAVGYHEIINNIREYAFRVDAARSVEAMPPAPGAMGQPYKRAYNLLETGKACWAETDIETLVKKRSVSLDPKVDKEGPLGVAAVYEQPDRTPYGQPLPSGMPRTRIVAVGSADFMIGGQFSFFGPPQGNVLFFFNAVNWLAEKTELISIPPKRFDFRPMDRIDTTNEPLRKWFNAEVSNRRLVFWLALLALPALFLILGGVIWMFRRRS